MRRFGITDFRDVTQAGMIQMLVERRKKSCTRLLSYVSVRTVDAYPRLNKRADQPGPDRTLVIDRISRTRVALIMRRVSAFSGRERAQTHRRSQKHLHRIDNSARFFFRQQRERSSADGKDLVWSECEIDSAGLVIAINNF